MTKLAPAYEYILQLENKPGFDGHISIEHGFLPTSDPIEELPEKYKSWDSIASQLPYLIANYHIKDSLEKLEILDASSPELLPDTCLSRASVILSAFAHAYQYSQRNDMLQSPIPKSVMSPWQDISIRLGRSIVNSDMNTSQAMIGRTCWDDFLYNWTYKDSLSRNRSISNMKLLVSYFDCSEENISTLAIPAIEAAFAPSIGAILQAQNAVLKDDKNHVVQSLDIIIDSLKKVKKIFSTINCKSGALEPLDPIVWGKTFALIGKRVHETELSNSGSDTPLFHALDAFLGRSEYDTEMGSQMKARRMSFPESYRMFFSYLRQVSIVQYALERPDVAVKLEELCDVYFGESSFLKQHRLKQYGFIKIAMLSGRTQTNNGVSDTIGCKNQKWHDIYNELTSGINERKVSSISLFGCPFKQYVKKIEKSHPTTVTESFNVFELALHSSNSVDCRHWVSINSIVYDITEYVEKHPGGEKILICNYGDDATSDFEQIKHNDCSYIMPILNKYKIGKLVDNLGGRDLFNLMQAIVKLENTLYITTEYKRNIPAHLYGDAMDNFIEGYFIPLLNLARQYIGVDSDQIKLKKISKDFSLKIKQYIKSQSKNENIANEVIRRFFCEFRESVFSCTLNIKNELYNIFVSDSQLLQNNGLINEILSLEKIVCTYTRDIDLHRLSEKPLNRSQNKVNGKRDISFPSFKLANMLMIGEICMLSMLVILISVFTLFLKKLNSEHENSFVYKF